jgi:hypothetical protein
MGLLADLKRISLWTDRQAHMHTYIQIYIVVVTKEIKEKRMLKLKDIETSH